MWQGIPLSGDCGKEDSSPYCKEMNLRILGVALVLVGTLSLTSPAHAQDFNFSFDDSVDGISGYGTFITTSLGGGEYDVTGVTGFVLDSNYSYLGPDPIQPSTPSSFNAADNILFYPGIPYITDGGGISFQTNADAYNLFDGDIQDANNLPGAGILDSFIVTPVPEPNYGFIVFAVALGLFGWKRFSTRAADPA